LYKEDEGDQDILFFNLRDSYESFNPELSKVKNPLTYQDVRTAISFCLNSKRVNEKIFFSLNEISHEWGSAEDLVEENSIHVFNPVQGSEMLEAMGWTDHDGNKRTGRIASGFQDVPDGTSLTFTYLIINTKDDLAAAYIYKESLAECGVDIIITPVPAEQFWNPTFDTSIFQGHFDLAQVKWSTPIHNPCPLITNTNIPDENNDFSGLNFSALNKQLIDEQCARLDESAFQSEREHALNKIWQVISQEKSMLKMYAYQEIIVTRSDFCEITTSTKTSLSDFEAFNYGINCH